MAAPTHTCDQVDNITEIQKKITKLDEVVFLGNGQKPITVRVAEIQTCLRIIMWGMAVLTGAVVSQITIQIFSK